MDILPPTSRQGSNGWRKVCNPKWIGSTKRSAVARTGCPPTSGCINNCKMISEPILKYRQLCRTWESDQVSDGEFKREKTKILTEK